MPPSKKQVQIDLKFASPESMLFCDKFAIREDGEFYDLDFASSRSGKCISIRIQRITIEGQKEGFSRYLNEIGMTETTAPEQPRLSADEAFFADFVGLARHGAMAEFVFHALSWKVTIDGGRAAAGKKSAKLDDEKIVANAFCVALIRSTIELQRHWIYELYKL